ncbi:RNase H domain-containing protein [Colletotrichum costaricense]|uniref:ribonuclease H n=1 Tax=Colletotrichum costaricense TaxID=1209916 RepID=A0AAI9Z7L2_9PEZI|nr:RNase H domain-containing protein [Colletotrichum costaricense]KAK1537016.1 RNase H domain-containing protein [Colletotrichum costaricense]
MTWPDIDYLELPNGRTIIVCASHHMVTCGKCCLDFSHDFEYDEDGNYLDEDDEEIFGFDYDSRLPRDVSFAHVARSRYGRPERITASGSRRSSARVQSTWDDEDDDDSDGPPPLIDDDELISTVRMGEGPKIVLGAPTLNPSVSCRSEFSGKLFPFKFNPHHDPQTSTPLEPKELFLPKKSSIAIPSVIRFINRYDDSEVLIYTDGACLDNGNAAARGGSAFIFKPVLPNDESGCVAFKLEDKGPDGQTYRHTSNRAELRAALAALQFRAWWGEGFKSIVIATDSSYVVNGATDWARAWIKKGWRTSAGEHVKNRDLWEALLLRSEILHDNNVHVRFWYIPRKFNNEADRAAKRAAAIVEPTVEFSEIMGVLV